MVFAKQHPLMHAAGPLAGKLEDPQRPNNGLDGGKKMDERGMGGQRLAVIGQGGGWIGLAWWPFPCLSHYPKSMWNTQGLSQHIVGTLEQMSCYPKETSSS